ncbi:uncharacterized protein LOC131666993 [Phymastichus coffea]|uniref:uncharacterized protein LOC131666993 n=1 Tax=Phymastichus coffea TaxID=108790 RepID=UPI00273BDB38|nr:uncharacterized protein LOC131666993 [Phymastichus coffea]
MDLLTLTLLIAAVYAAYRYVSGKRARFADKGVPCVGYPPLGSNAIALFRLKHVADALTELYDTHPEAKYVGAFDFARPMILLRDPELIKLVTIKHFDSFPNHQPFFDVTLDPLFAGNLFNITGEQWKETRNMLTPSFTASKMKGMHELIEQCAKNFVGHLDALPSDVRKMMGTKELFTKFTNDAIATCAFGIEVDSLKNPSNEFYVLGQGATNFDGIMGIKFIAFRLFPYLMKLFKVRLFTKRVADFFESVVATTVKTREEKGIVRPDMIQLMMNARSKNNESIKLDITSMTANAFTFFFGGFETTSTQMCAMAHELAINPDVQKKLQHEIDEVMQRSNASPTYEDIQGMLYLDAVFNETMRRHSPIAVLDRNCVKAFELPPAVAGAKPYLIKPGDGVWIPVTPIHMDPKYYENPKRFDPERYYDKKITINDVTNLGFGIGPRSCIANRFAAMEIKTLFVHLLSSFNLVANEKTCSPYVYSKASFSAKPVGGFWLAVEPRKHVSHAESITFSSRVVFLFYQLLFTIISAMDFSTYALIIIVVYEIYYYLNRRRAIFMEQGVPCYGWPLLSNIILYFLMPMSLADQLKMTYNKYSKAKYFGSFNIFQPVVVVRDLELIKTMAIKNFESFPAHMRYFDYSLDKLFGSQLFNSTGEYWKNTKAILSPAFTPSKLKNMHGFVVECAKEFVGHLNQLPVSERMWLETKELLSRFTNDAIASSAYGIKIDSMRNPNNKFYVLGSKATNLDTTTGIKFIALNVFPKFCRLMNMGLFNTEVYDFFKDIVEKTMRMREETGIRRADLIQLMMKTQESGMKMDIFDMTAQAFTFFFAGFETTSTLMSALAYELALNPDIQKKLQLEIDQVMRRSNGNLTYEDINDMPYFDSVIAEALRAHPPLIVIDRICDKDYQLPPAVPGGKPFTVKSGMGVIFPAAAIQRDPKYFDDPDKFDPERYAGKKFTFNDVTNLGFGIGPRNCLGYRFANMTVKVLFSYILTDFNLIPNSKTRSPYTYSWFSYTVRPPGGYCLAIEPRKSK